VHVLKEVGQPIKTNNHPEVSSNQLKQETSGTSWRHQYLISFAITVCPSSASRCRKTTSSKRPSWYACCNHTHNPPFEF